MRTEEIILKGQFDKNINLDISYPDGQGPFPTIVFLHGVRGFKDWGAWHLMAKYFIEKGFAFLKFNFSHNGIGEDDKEVFEDIEGFAENNFLIELSDLDSVMSWLRSQSFCDQKSINLLAHSRGGGIAIIYANENPCIASVITLAAVSDYHRYIGAWDIDQWRKEGFLEFVNSRTKQVFKINLQFWDVLEANEELLNIKRACENLHSKLLVIHAEDDEAVSVSQAKELALWTKDSESYITKSGGHTFGMKHPYASSKLPDSAQMVCDRILEFIT